jgi:hypothetical protein
MVYTLIQALLGLSSRTCRCCGHAIQNDDFGSSEGVCAPCRR